MNSNKTVTAMNLSQSPQEIFWVGDEHANVRPTYRAIWKTIIENKPGERYAIVTHAAELRASRLIIRELQSCTSLDGKIFPIVLPKIILFFLKDYVESDETKIINHGTIVHHDLKKNAIFHNFLKSWFASLENPKEKDFSRTSLLPGQVYCQAEKLEGNLRLFACLDFIPDAAASRFPRRPLLFPTCNYNIPSPK